MVPKELGWSNAVVAVRSPALSLGSVWLAVERVELKVSLNIFHLSFKLLSHHQKQSLSRMGNRTDETCMKLDARGIFYYKCVCLGLTQSLVCFRLDGDWLGLQHDYLNKRESQNQNQRFTEKLFQLYRFQGRTLNVSSFDQGC